LKLKNIVVTVVLTSIILVGFLGLATNPVQAATKGVKVVSTRQIINQPTTKLIRGRLYKNKSMTKTKANLGSKKNKLHNQIAVIHQQLKVRKANGKRAVVYQVTFKHHLKTAGYVWAKGLKLSKKITFKKSVTKHGTIAQSAAKGTKSSDAQAAAKKADKAVQAKAKKQGWGVYQDPSGGEGNGGGKMGPWMP